MLNQKKNIRNAVHKFERTSLSLFFFYVQACETSIPALQKLNEHETGKITTFFLILFLNKINQIHSTSNLMAGPAIHSLLLKSVRNFPRFTDFRPKSDSRFINKYINWHSPMAQDNNNGSFSK